MPFGQGTVFVLGAGFTKGFFPAAPLLVDKYDLDDLASPSNGVVSESATLILQAELNSQPDGKVNLERLMTRLSGGMPYDRQRGVERELPLLLERVQQEFVSRLTRATGPISEHQSTLLRFARHCIREKTTCITFNYDEVLDRTLWAASSGEGQSGDRWNPESGYGFPCRPSAAVLGPHFVLNAPTAMHLLKLHGSINWHATLGHARPYDASAIVHHSEWTGPPPGFYHAQNYLETRPFIVPPVLTKAELVEHPVLSVLWYRAFGALVQAEQIVFIGYSLPMTDVGGGFLFREAWRGRGAGAVTVVDRAPPGQEDAKRANLHASYCEVFRGLRPEQIQLCGGVKWIEDNIQPEA
jgi:hypothetical protein